MIASADSMSLRNPAFLVTPVMPSDPDFVDYLSLLDSIQEFIAVKDGAGRWLFCNQTASPPTR